ncbi:MAG TPA: hypothetical protein PLN33_05970 [Hyphomonadaceae bacterium]|jgi:hypothetical protein|nr:hypothetical protein [Hyphomonadaceae bacterium]HPN06159.1 hypothetical protein [Hyphomonadaceae bacterium]
MIWRRISGACLVMTGASAAAGMIIVGFAILARYLKLPDAADTLGGASSVAMPLFLTGGLVLLIGRWFYGAWNDRASVINAVAFGIRTAGTFVAMALGGVLILMLVTGIEPGDATAAVVLALGAATGLALVAISIHMRGGDIYSA